MDPSQAFGVRWVHVFEEDTPAGAVYRPASARIPLSRRPRRQFELRRNGSAVLYTGGADDRPVSRPGRWRTEGDAIAVAFPGRGAEPAVSFRVIEVSASRLVASS